MFHKSIKISMLAAICLVLFSVPFVFAKSNNEGSKYLFQTGLRAIERGDYQAGIHEMKKALMIDPTNEEVRLKLEDLGVSEGFYTGSKTHLSQLAEMSLEIVERKNKIERLEIEKAAIEYKFKMLQEENGNLFDLVDQKNSQLSELKESVSVLEHDKVALMKENNALTRIKSSIDSAQELMQKRGEVEITLITPNNGLSKKRRLPVFAELSSMRKKLKDSVDHAVELEQHMEVINKKYDRMNTGTYGLYFHQNKVLDSMGNHLAQQDVDMEDSLDELTTQGVDLLGTQQILTERVEELDHLHGSLLQYQEWLDIRTNVIKDKNEEIKRLNEGLE